jgi:hypothetical protein
VGGILVAIGVVEAETLIVGQGCVRISIRFATSYLDERGDPQKRLGEHGSQTNENTNQCLFCTSKVSRSRWLRVVRPVYQQQTSSVKSISIYAYKHHRSTT